MSQGPISDARPGQTSISTETDSGEVAVIAGPALPVVTAARAGPFRRLSMQTGAAALAL